MHARSVRPLSARRGARARAAAAPPVNKAQALLALQADAGNRAVTRSLAARTPPPGVLQRVIRLEDDARVMQPQDARMVHDHLLAKGIHVADNPRLAALVDAWIAETTNHDYTSADRLVAGVCGELIERYRQALGALGAPSVVTSLGHGHKNGLALLVAIGGYDPARLFELLAQAQATPNIDSASFTNTVGKYFSPVSDPTTYLRRGALRDDFLRGRVGQMVGFVGELEAALGAARADSARFVVMGRDVPARSETGRNLLQDVDLYFVSGGVEHCFEVAANVNVLREKTRPDNPQMRRYDTIRAAKPSVVLGYAVGQPRAWPNVFRGEDLVDRLSAGKRSLQLDGVVWTPAQIVAMQDRVRFLLGAYGGYQPEALLQALAMFTAGEFEALPDAKVVSQVGNAVGIRGREVQRALLLGRVRDSIQSISTAVAAALHVVETRGSGDTRLNAALTRLRELWSGQSRRLVDVLLKFGKQPQPINPNQVKKAVETFQAVRAVMLDELAREGENAPPHAAAFTLSVMEQARKTLEERVGSVDYTQALAV